LSLKELYVLFSLAWHEKFSFSMENIKNIPFLPIAHCQLFFLGLFLGIGFKVI